MTLNSTHCTIKLKKWTALNDWALEDWVGKLCYLWTDPAELYPCSQSLIFVLSYVTQLLVVASYQIYRHERDIKKQPINLPSNAELFFKRPSHMLLPISSAVVYIFFIDWLTAVLRIETHRLRCLSLLQLSSTILTSMQTCFFSSAVFKWILMYMHDVGLDRDCFFYVCFFHPVFVLKPFLESDIFNL